ncbi:hypothetical protein B0T21DRAFT_433942 [Apiosordaria backusii]|uniref:RING-type domain-containing protein n=1 Tax=Apiosordaria backusii TaxID=314023 RepID=A0AA40EMP2_9PEZI|nr:hypothetical protein B0T21DRAFT_433942 [Apiosordaria backusii]
MLIGREQAGIRASKSFPAPVNGLTDDPISTSGDVHLYADPATHHESHPVLFADCEGLGGGESAPRAKEYQGNSKSARRKIQQKIRWAKDSMTSSRGFAVKRLFPRILYTFSDVIVFVIQEARTFQSDVLVNLVEWAYFSIEKAVNQPVLPHLIIALNRTDNAIDEEQWDTGIATDKLLGAHKDITQVPELISIVQGLRRTGRNVKSAKELLECFYRSITVVRIPTKGRYMQIDDQIGKLYAAIREKGTNSHTEKKSVRMALNAEKLHQFMNAAYDHFSANLNQPFDFVKEALLLNPMPHDFQGHMLHLILAVRNGASHVGGSRTELRLLEKVKPLLASCMTLIITRNNLTGKIKDLLDGTFRKPARMAFEELCDKWLPCGFESKGQICCNVRYAHVKGHQASSGKIFQKGEYQPRVTDDQFEEWFKGIGTELEKMMDELPRVGSEKENAWGKHLQRIERFYEDNSRFSENISHGTCFCCINNVPEHVLPCGHVLCTECITALGGQMERDILFIKYCPFHRQKHNWERNPVQIRFKPECAGIRALCLDGGGVRGLVELIMLEELQKQLNNIPVQNFFDLIVGTRHCCSRPRS